MEINLQHLEDIVGADNVASDSETCKVYSKDVASVPSISGQILVDTFSVVVQPIIVESLQKLMVYAAKRNIPITLRGNGTSGWGGAIPTRGGVCVSLTQMSKILNLDDYGSTITVESGITWRELLLFLDQIGTTLPVYPSSATAATVGGFVASGGLGIGSSKYGDIRTQISGIEAVLANGKLVRLGKLVLPQSDHLAESAEQGTKWFLEWLDNRVGSENIDPMSFLVGTYGVFGVITKVTLKTIHKLQMLPFAISFETIDDLVNATVQIITETDPYHLRYLTNHYTSKLRALTGLIFEEGRFILTGALLDTIYQNEESIESIKRITEAYGGVILDNKRAQFHWDERLFPLRFKRLGPSLVPAEVLVPQAEIPSLLRETNKKLSGSQFAVEGTMDKSGLASFMVWILDDERNRMSYTIGWYRSFDIAALAKKHGGSAYAIALWNSMYAEEFYGQKLFKEFKAFKKEIDPKNLLNTMKVFGGRVKAAFPSQAFGFVAGFMSVILVGYLALIIPGFEWVFDLLSTQPFLGLHIPLLLFAALIGGVVGVSIIRLMSLKVAMTLILPILRVLGKFIRRPG